MFGTSGIRGRVGEAVTADLALDVGRALGTDRERVVVGRDPRESGLLLVDSLAAGLRETGADVVDLGMASTPTVARAVAWEGADAGVSVTASHNPATDNGIKLWQPSGQAFDEPLREVITERVQQERFDLRPWDGLGERFSVEDAAERHAAAIAESVALDSSPDVVVDLGNGAGGVTVDALQRLGCHVETLNAQPDGAFPGRPSEPTRENCGSLAALTAETDALLGIAHDGDADRTRVATAEGEFVSGDVQLALLAAAAVADARAQGRDAETVAIPVDTSLAVEDYLSDRGVDCVRTPVGDVYVAAKAAEPGVAFGGEPSGAWIWPEETLCPDGPLAAAKLVALAAERPLAERVADVPTYPIRRDSVTVEDKGAVMARIESSVTDDYESVSAVDGVRVDLGDAWFLLRASGTEPVIRVTAEARDETRADDVLEEARGVLAGAR